LRIKQPLSVATLALALGMTAFAQSAPVAADSPAETAPGVVPKAAVSQATPLFGPSPAVRILEDFKAGDVKFDVNELADILRDRRHEGWVLVAYPDPKTKQPLIGAGFSLDLPAREHPQPDSMNSHPFLEPSSADLWQAAGFDPARLDGILNVFYERRRAWSKRTWHKQMMNLPEQITDEEAMQLVRIGAIQAVYNARAYCRNFDQMTGPQQMAMAQLVYQMGVNLEHFNSFLAMVNPGPGARAEAAGLTVTAQDGPVAMDQTTEYWTGVQKSLMTTQWARLYRTRAISVIAMLDPAYGDDPGAAERRVGATLRPAVAHRRGRKTAATREVAATTTHRGHGKKAGHTSARAKSRKRA
jgi:hypothetical protein